MYNDARLSGIPLRSSSHRPVLSINILDVYEAIRCPGDGYAVAVREHHSPYVWVEHVLVIDGHRYGRGADVSMKISRARHVDPNRITKTADEHESNRVAGFVVNCEG